MTNCASRRRSLQALPAATLAASALPAFAAAAPRRVIDLTFERDRANMNRRTVKEHSGTHLDAPLHFSGDGLSLAEIKAEDLVVPLSVIDITARAQQDANAVLMPDDVKAH